MVLSIDNILWLFICILYSSLVELQYTIYAIALFIMCIIFTKNINDNIYFNITISIYLNFICIIVVEASFKQTKKWMYCIHDTPLGVCASENICVN